MLRLGDLAIADWGFFNWVCEEEPVTQVRILLFNGTVFIMDYEDFMSLADDESCF